MIARESGKGVPYRLYNAGYETAPFWIGVTLLERDHGPCRPKASPGRTTLGVLISGLNTPSRSLRKAADTGTSGNQS